MAGGKGVCVVGIGVAGALVGGTAVGSNGVEVATTGVGGRLVLVGKTCTAVVAVGVLGAWVFIGGGAPLDGKWQAVAIKESITSVMQVTRNFLFIFSSLDSRA
jgi:hypothetical protein